MKNEKNFELIGLFLIIFIGTIVGFVLSDIFLKDFEQTESTESDDIYLECINHYIVNDCSEFEMGNVSNRILVSYNNGRFFVLAIEGVDIRDIWHEVDDDVDISLKKLIRKMPNDNGLWIGEFGVNIDYEENGISVKWNRPLYQHVLRLISGESPFKYGELV